MWRNLGYRSLLGRARAINNRGKNQIPSELGRAEKKQPSTGGVALLSVQGGRVGILDTGLLRNPRERKPVHRVLYEHLRNQVPLRQVKWIWLHFRSAFTYPSVSCECSLASKGVNPIREFISQNTQGPYLNMVIMFCLLNHFRLVRLGVDWGVLEGIKSLSSKNWIEEQLISSNPLRSGSNRTRPKGILYRGNCWRQPKEVRVLLTISIARWQWQATGFLQIHEEHTQMVKQCT